MGLLVAAIQIRSFTSLHTRSDALDSGRRNPIQLVGNRPMTAAAASAIFVAYSSAAITFSLMRIFDWPRDVVAAGNAALFVGAALLLVPPAHRPHTRALGSTVGKSLALFIGLYGYTTALAGIDGLRSDYYAMWSQLVMALLPAILFLGCFNAAVRYELDPTFWYIPFGLMSLCFMSISLEYTGILRFEQYGARYFGFMSDGVAWVLSFCVVIFFAAHRYAFVALSMALLALTQSRGAALTVAAAIALLVILHRGSRSRLRSILTLALMVIAGYLLLFEQIDTMLDRVLHTDLANNDRIWTINLSLDLFRQSPVYGSGYNAQTHIYTREYIQALALQGFSTPTSTLFQIMADGGLLATAGFIVFVTRLTGLCMATIRYPADSREALLIQGLAVWLVAFAWTNQSAAWLIPGSYLSPLVFASAGVVAGRSYRSRCLANSSPQPLSRSSNDRIRQQSTTRPG